MTQRKLRKTPCLFAVMAALLMLLTGCAKEAEQRSLSVNELNSSRYTIGVDQGSMSDLIAEEVFSEANFEYFSDKFMGYKAVADGKVDAFVYDRRQMEIAIEKGLTGVGLLDETLGQPIDIAVGLSPVSGIDDLEGKINAFIAEIRSDGTLDDMFRRWVTEGNDVMPDIPAPDAPTEHLTVATSGIVEPFSYYGETGLTGYDIELATRFASWLNAELEFKIYDYGAIVAAAQSGDVDCIMADLNVSEERRQELPFSDILFSETAGIMVREGASESASLEYKNFDQLSGHRIGVLTGTEHARLVQENVPSADIQYYNTSPDLYQALRSNKIDAYAEDDIIINFMSTDDDGVYWMPEHLDMLDTAFAFAKDDKGEALRDEINEFVRACYKDGTIDELNDIWLGKDEEKKQPTGYESLPAVNGTIRAAVNTQGMPMVYMKNNVIVGFETDLLTRFCRAKGYALELEDMDFSAVLAAVQSGKADLGAANMSVTEERSRSMLFSEPHFKSGVVMVVRTKSGGQKDGFFRKMGDSFRKTFITENRWRLFLKGIGNTLLIGILSVLFGTSLGFGLYMICRRGGRIAIGVTRAAVWLVQAMPILVLLMVLYYVIFGSIAISGMAVAVIGFSITFGSAVFGMFSTGVSTVDKGQTEAAYALGLSSWRTFFDIILPQALPHILPSYKAQIGALIRSTSIVGYIAVQDLTKMGDIVRSRTYEAFFPLLVVAVIYVLLTVLVNSLTGMAIDRIDPRKRAREAILKGVNTHD